ncbi:nucleotidyltransferase domain-containing protein [Candidatus Micrarchaeota archaeon]|nr:nucleotidyltransferase domain-containing protein [Candidatus Micrarchaeota archaeon]
MGRIKDKVAVSFAKRVKKTYVDARIFLFGSRARKDELKDSDYDFIVISQAFEKIPFVERMVRMQQLWENRQLLETVCYTPGEFKRKSKEIGIVSTAIAEGVRLA